MIPLAPTCQEFHASNFLQPKQQIHFVIFHFFYFDK